MKFFPPRSLRHHVLVVDDEEIVLVALRETLRQLGLRVTAVSDAVDGLACLRAHEFSIVITDHQMPRLTGLEFLAQVRQIQPRASRILISAVLNISTVIDAINRAEICRFLLKPWQREDLLATLEAALERFEDVDNLHKDLERLKGENLSLQNQVKLLEQERCAVSSPSPNQP
jgi:two-component system probable response regulator PhcQ